MTDGRVTVAQREGEFSVRAALGAQPADLRKLVFRQGAIVGGIGVALGVGSAIIGGRLVESQLYGVAAADPMAIGGVAIVLLLIVAGSTIVPALRASRVSAARVLRS